MSEPQNNHEALVSKLAGDADMLELVQMFVEELPDKAAALEQRLAERDFDNLAQLAHQLKGAAGGYGFPTITELAAGVEQSAKNRAALDRLAAEVKELVGLCKSARATPTDS